MRCIARLCLPSLLMLFAHQTAAQETKQSLASFKGLGVSFQHAPDWKIDQKGNERIGQVTVIGPKNCLVAVTIMPAKTSAERFLEFLKRRTVGRWEKRGFRVGEVKEQEGVVAGNKTRGFVFDATKSSGETVQVAAYTNTSGSRTLSLLTQVPSDLSEQTRRHLKVVVDTLQVD